MKALAVVKDIENRVFNLLKNESSDNINNDNEIKEIQKKFNSLG